MATSIEDLPLDRDVSSAEGVSLDYMARVRIAYLVGQNQTMVTQTQFADAKAGEVTLPRDEIHSAKLVLTDALIAATQPIDTTGADELLEDTEEKADD